MIYTAFIALAAAGDEFDFDPNMMAGVNMGRGFNGGFKVDGGFVDGGFVDPRMGGFVEPRMARPIERAAFVQPNGGMVESRLAQLEHHIQIIQRDCCPQPQAVPVMMKQKVRVARPEIIEQQAMVEERFVKHTPVTVRSVAVRHEEVEVDVQAFDIGNGQLVDQHGNPVDQQGNPIGRFRGAM